MVFEYRLPRIFTNMVSFVDDSRTMCSIMSPQTTFNNMYAKRSPMIYLLFPRREELIDFVSSINRHTTELNSSSISLQKSYDCTNTSNPQVYKILLIYTGGCMIIFIGVAMYMKKIGLKLVLSK